MDRNYKKGFTLIELLVVIAIIGILSAVVLASLNTARQRGADAAIRSNLSNIRAQAALFYEEGNTFENVCTSDPVVAGMVAEAGERSAGSGTVHGCTSDADTWVAYGTLNNPPTGMTVFCVDSTGRAQDQAAAPTMTGGDYSCE